MHQQEFIYNYDQKYREKFNPQLFNRSDDNIIYYLENIIKSTERQMGVNGYFTIKVQNFTVVDNYKDIINILGTNLATTIARSSKLKSTMDNRYDFIDLKDSDLKLLIVTYYIEAQDGRELFDIIIAVPRVIEKFYFKINGNVRYPMYQIVDAFTYNSRTSTSKNTIVTVKTTFQPIRVYRNTLVKEDIHNQEVPMVTYDASIFKKSVPMCKYIFAEMGFIKGLQFLGLDGIIKITNYDMNDPNWYTFLPKKTSGIHINVLKEALHNLPIVQHVTLTICNEFTRKFANLPFIFTREFWLDALGRHFNLATPRNKGISVLTSLKLIYDRTTIEKVRLPLQDKESIFTIFRWVLYEFNSLLTKDNLDISIKRLRCEEYIASLYAPRLSKAIYALSDMGEKADIKTVKKRLNTDPMFLINEIAKCNLVNFRDITTDNDSYLALKYTYKGISGIGESGSNAVPDIYRYVHVSNLGIVDTSASSPSDPGSTSMIVPLINLYDGGYFRDIHEPDNWREILKYQWQGFKKNDTKKEVVDFDRAILQNLDYSNEDLQIKDYMNIEDK